MGMSAPDLTGPVSILNWPVAGPPSGRRRRPRLFTHVHLEVDLRPELPAAAGGIVRRVEKLLGEREVVEARDLLRLSARVLHAFSAVGFVRIYHWEAKPGGWLPLPGGSAEGPAEPLGHLLRALDSDAWATLRGARSLALRLGAVGNLRADVEIRRRHRERQHTLSIDLRGRFPGTTVEDLFGALRSRTQVRASRVTTSASAGT